MCGAPDCKSCYPQTYRQARRDFARQEAGLDVPLCGTCGKPAESREDADGDKVSVCCGETFYTPDPSDDEPDEPDLRPWL